MLNGQVESRHWLPALIVAGGSLGLIAPSAEAQRMAARKIADVSAPVWVGTPPGDRERIFVNGRFNGEIRVVKNGVLLPTPFLNIGPYRAEGDGGFLGVAFHPDYEANGYFYVYYTDTNGDGVVMRYTVSAEDPDIADANSGAEIIKILRNPADNLHAGGFIGFSPVDGFLYISHGDAGPQEDPNGNSQNPGLLLGKILRIDVDSAFPYAVPEDNPFVNDPETLDEIWAIGFRNPWRASFDRETGDLWVGDVGQVTWEEVSVIPNGVGGGNYGWNVKEGTHCFNPPEDCDPENEMIDPIYEYRHRYIPPFRCSVTGGYVYRGQAMPLYDGRYFFSDFCGNTIWSFLYDGSDVRDFRNHTDELTPPGGGFEPSISSYGEDPDGELYICDYGRNALYKIVTELDLSVTTLTAGAPSTLTATGGTPLDRVYFVYSVTGIGVTEVPPLGATLAIANPQLIGVDQADETGLATLTRTVPTGTSGIRVWLQAAVVGNTSNVLPREIN